MTGATALAIAGGFLAFGAGSASAATTPPFEPDPSAIGSISFFNSAGAPVTGGNLTDQIAAYAQGSAQPDAGDVKAALFGYLPKNGQVPGQFSGEGLTGASVYPNAAAPGSLGTSGLPLDTISAADATFGNLVADFTNTATDSYAGLYEIRMRTSQAGTTASSTYDRADIQTANVTFDSSGNVTGGTWTLVYPVPVTSTSTVLTAAPSPGTVGQSITLTATESPAAAGSVQFKDGTTTIGSPVAVNGSGVATTSTSTLAQGTHALSAVFTPTDPTSFAASTGTASEVVNPASTPTTTALAVGGSNTTAGADATLTATVTGPGTTPNGAGTVAFYDNGSTTALPGTVTTPSTGVYALDLPTGFAAGNHSVVAKFTPTNLANFEASQSAAQAFSTQAAQVGACLQAGSTCTDTQNIQATVPVGTLIIHTPYTAATPLDLGTLALQPNATEYSGSGTFSNIQIVDTRAGDLPYTVTALSSNLTDGGTNAGSTINSQNIGLTGLTPAGSGGFSSPVHTVDNPAANPAVAANAPLQAAGQQGLGINPHSIVTVDHGLGTLTMNGTLTITAPTSTEAGLFTGTITFTVG
jgi:hypothetical protein